jgi:hypothetical protein
MADENAEARREAPIHAEVRRRQAAGKCGRCNMQLSIAAGDCPIHGDDTAAEAMPKFPGMSEGYRTSGTFKPNSTLDDYNHFAWYKGGLLHFGNEACSLGLCKDNSSHPDQVVVHFKIAGDGKKVLNPSQQEAILKLMEAARKPEPRVMPIPGVRNPGGSRPATRQQDVSDSPAPEDVTSMSGSEVLPRNIRPSASGLDIWSTVKSIGGFKKKNSRGKVVRETSQSPLEAR